MTTWTTAAWPELPYEGWKPTKETIHRFCQIVGKVRMALVPKRNHWWHVTLYPSARGLTTAAMPYGPMTVEIQFDFVDHHLRVTTSAGAVHQVALRDRLSCASFYGDLMQALGQAGVEVSINPEPFDLGDSPRLSEDEIHDDYDADAVERWWTVLRRTDQALMRFRSRFNGKASPVHLFWHSFDLAHARFSGRPAPPIEGRRPRHP